MCGAISISRFWITARRQLSTRTRSQAVPVIIPLSGGTWLLLIRCMKAETKYLVSPQMRLEDQAAAAAAAVGCLCFWTLIMNEMILFSNVLQIFEVHKTPEKQELECVSRLCLWVVFSRAKTLPALFILNSFFEVGSNPDSHFCTRPSPWTTDSHGLITPQSFSSLQKSA